MANSATLHGKGHRTNREIRSREIAERQFAPAIIPRPAHLEQLDLNLGDDVVVTHFAPSPVWGETVATRRHARLMAITINPGTLEVKCALQDRRAAIMNGSWWRFCFVDQSDYGNGMFHISPHPGFAFWTGGCTMSEDPMDGLVQRQLSLPYSRNQRLGVVRVGSGAGLLIERATFEANRRNAYVAGVTGLVAIPGNSTFAAQPAPAIGNLFRWNLPTDASSWTEQCIEITAAAAAPTGGGYSHPASLTIAAGATYCLCIDHHDDAGADLYFFLSRASDGLYWNAATNTWAAGPIGNVMPLSTAGWTRYVSRPIAGPAANTTYTVSLTQAAGGTVLRKNRIACVNLNSAPFPHSRLVTDTGLTTDPNPYMGGAPSSHDQFIISNKTLSPGSGIGSVLRHKRGTFLAKFKRNWNGPEGAVDQRSGHLGYLMLLGTAPQPLAIYHDGPNNRWTMIRRNAAGVATTITVTPTTYTPPGNFDMIVAARWASPTSEGGELDWKYGSAGAGTEQNFDLFVITTPFANGQASARGTNSSAPVGSDNEVIQIGNSPSGDALDAAVQIIGFTDYVLTDEEIMSFAWEEV